jgi:hypothetical protein
MKDFIEKLPFDIVLKIISYTYNVQNKKLLCDIINYNQTKIILIELYNNFWNIYLGFEPSEEECKKMFSDYLFLYVNYKNIYYNNIFKRNPFLPSEMKIDKYIYQLRKKEVNTQINILLGLLNPKERNEFIVDSLQ